MKNRFVASIAFLGITTLLFTGCSKLPQAEIDLTNVAIEEAKAAGADVYVPENYVALQDSMKGVMANIESQNSKFIKNYSKAKEDLAYVTQFAGEVKQQAETRKEEMKVEIQQTIAEVKALIESNRNLILEAPKGKEGTTALKAIKGEIDAIEATVSQVNTLFENGDYIATLEKANAAKQNATSINTELSDVIAKYKANVAGRRS